MKLKPCPFCGSSRVRYLTMSTPDVENGAVVECRACFTMGPVARVVSNAEAKRLWNQRVEVRASERTVVFCVHANEVPARCPCKRGCYCKLNACKGRRSA